MKRNIIRAGLIAAAVFAVVTHSIMVPLAFLALLAVTIAPRTSGVFRVTLSVPELSQMVIEAFKFQTPELFGQNGFALDVNSQTARLGDTVTSHVVGVPTAQDYDQTTGFENNVTDATSLLTDVPVTLSYLKHVPIRIKLLSQLSSKVNLQQTLMEQGYALRKLIIDTALQTITSGNFSHQLPSATLNVNLDTVEALRTKLNNQKAAPFGRFGIVSSAVAGAIQADQRVGSSLFYQQLNGDNAYRRYKNLAGFGNVFEYPDFPTAGNLTGYFGDRRGIVVAVRPIDFAQVKASDLGIPENMAIFPQVDPESGMPFTAVGYQKYGTGDIVFSIALLFGVAAGNQGGSADTITDRAGVRLVSSGTES